MPRNSEVSKKVKLRILEWLTTYRLILLPLSILTVLFGTYLTVKSVHKHTVMQRDLKIFNEAEAKLRSLSLPKADKTTYRRDCSFRSVKFEDPGPPVCGVSRDDQYLLQNPSELLTQEIYGLLQEQGGTQNQRFSQGFTIGELSYIDERDGVVELPSYGDGLQCSSGLLAVYTDDTHITLVTGCYKRVKYQLFEER